MNVVRCRNLNSGLKIHQTHINKRIRKSGSCQFPNSFRTKGSYTNPPTNSPEQYENVHTALHTRPEKGAYSWTPAPPVSAEPLLSEESLVAASKPPSKNLSREGMGGIYVCKVPINPAIFITTVWHETQPLTVRLEYLLPLPASVELKQLLTACHRRPDYKSRFRLQE